MLMRLAALALVILSLVPAAFALEPQPSSQELFQRAIQLHDAGDYDGAIAIYKQLLEVAPGSEEVRYELTFSTFAKGDFTQAIALASGGASSRGKYQKIYFEILGNSYDGLQRKSEAVDAFKRGIKIDPAYPSLHFNLGVTYTGMNKMREARQEFERAIELNGAYASAHYALAELYRTQGYRVPAVLAYGRFLSLSPTGTRATSAATQLRALLTTGVERQDETHINITISTGGKKDLGDFGPLEMMMAIAGSTEHLAEKDPLSLFERQSESYSTFLAMLTESAGDMSRGFVKKVYAPFYVHMKEANQTETFAHLALAPLEAAGSSEWMAAHKSDIEQFLAWAKK